MDGGDIEEKKHTLMTGQSAEPILRQGDLVFRGVRIGHAQFGPPMALGEQSRQHAAERTELVEEADAADADGVIAAAGQARDDVRGVEDAGLLRGGFTARKANGEKARMFAGSGRRRQEAGEERLMGGVGEVAGGVPSLPAPAGQHGREVRRAALAQRLLSHVITECVQRDKQDVVRADQVVGIEHGCLRLTSARGHFLAMTARISAS